MYLDIVGGHSINSNSDNINNIMTPFFVPPTFSPLLLLLLVSFSALLYLNPMLLGSAFATALANGQGELQQLLAFQTTAEKAPVPSKSTDA